MKRIIIQNDSSQSDYNAIKAVMDVVAGGRVSNNSKCYCYLTVFPSKELLVASDVTKSGSDKFIVRNHVATIKAKEE